MGGPKSNFLNSRLNDVGPALCYPASVVTTLSLDNLDEGYEEIIYEYLGNTNSSNNHDCGVVTVM